jgi:isochorismate synthase
VGASPELLVARRGPGELPALRRIGAASPDPETDAANGAALAASGKNRHEHQLVVDTMRAALEPLCSDLDVAAQPQLTAPGAVASVHPDPRHAARNLHHRIGSALALHPTPAVGGVPTAAAVDLIAEIEGDRGFYAGAVGWCDARGDGRWVVAIRGARCRRTAARRWPRPAAVSWPNPIPTTNSPRPQRSSGPSCRRWESNNEPHPPGPSG